MRNPWLDFRQNSGGFVHPDDQPYVEAFNAVTGSPEHRLVTTLRPQPWAGPIRSARILVLGANPGWSPGDAEADDRLAPELDANLAGDRPLYWLGPVAAGTPGATWVRARLLGRILKELAALDNPDEVVANAVATLEFHAYHSPKWRPLPVTLPTQWYTFESVRARMNEGAMVIITRAEREWKVAVPELASYEHVFATHSVQNVQISPTNIGAAGWAELMERLHSFNRVWMGG